MFVKHHIEETYLYFVAAGFNIAIIVVDRSAKDPPRKLVAFRHLLVVAIAIYASLHMQPGFFTFAFRE